ncbi:PhzF family phenazine biosynthesis protein [Meiothermus granaticius]|uniref:Putative isomerase YddE n=1 Tax=Meiothermus granaticius NBRC 107808 TaxID=1227551 RepID=A0A399F8N9_9DEIN|nr:PhzF family phenazine biosynthesis protein [Meiothermus granaticius]RIH91272.1 putative isomerase YddE [Meiothermus granaticius NBRC 107808]GEM86079.1 phenazine biosynthesis protein PhzF [Meiothermus granaticius NBRC 107808]
MAKIPYLLVDAFTETPGGGNRVALILDARGMSPEEMQRVADRLHQSQAAFVTEWDSGGFGVRYFTSSGEVEFSGHASVALALTLAREGRVPPHTKKLYLRTIGEALSVELVEENDLPSKAVVRGPAPRFRDPPSFRTLREFMEALGADERYMHRGLPYGIAFTGLWSLFLPVVAPGLVDGLEPDMTRLSELTAGLELATVHVYTPLGPRSFYARTFAPLLGIPEDPVTGSANAALGALLARARVVPRWEGAIHLTVLQGHRLGATGSVDVRVEYGPSGAILGVFIGGKAVLAETGVLEL